MLTLLFYIIGVTKHDMKSELFNVQIRVLRGDSHVGEFTLQVKSDEAEVFKPLTGKMSSSVGVTF